MDTIGTRWSDNFVLEYCKSTRESDWESKNVTAESLDDDDDGTDGTTAAEVEETDDCCRVIISKINITRRI